jgi:hypothetical protein
MDKKERDQVMDKANNNTKEFLDAASLHKEGAVGSYPAQHYLLEQIR